MDVKCQGCFKIITKPLFVQIVVVCGNYQTVSCQPIGGRAKIKNRCNFVCYQHLMQMIPFSYIKRLYCGCGFFRGFYERNYVENRKVNVVMSYGENWLGCLWNFAKFI
ncbi:hypothetical protein NC653_038005 [Populus alba x Populus x berolinensis]|uniref:Uncharacterized protein n=1 Tax=Populus alba x Populus x berolinensis TaxID=444605 RepID=A0AAD6LFY1_9ROSI|nr:hypothetical protein NC653_038005 [Populus alba x Populus x berolinensis]